MHIIQNINSELELRNAILALETKQAEEGRVLKEQFHLTYESIKPANMIKNTIRQVFETKEIKQDILNTSVGLGAGFVSKKIFEGLTATPVKKILGSLILLAVSNLVTSSPGLVKNMGKMFRNLIAKKPADTLHEEDRNIIRQQ